MTLPIDIDATGARVNMEVDDDGAYPPRSTTVRMTGDEARELAAKLVGAADNLETCQHGRSMAFKGYRQEYCPKCDTWLVE